ncbi:MAG: hypothetical protein NTV49_10300 [Kiritimatiellaeota bacterium]|nr:hypothetical protein [Kiritimatiellota bacterium]
MHSRERVMTAFAHQAPDRVPCCGGMALAVLKAQYGDRILFSGAIDSHHVLIDGTPDSVRRQARAVLDIMAPGGGYIAGASHDTILEETPVANVLAMFDTVRDYHGPAAPSGGPACN